MRLSERLGPSDFPNRKLLVAHEGGDVSVAEREGKFYVIQDERSFAAILDPGDLEGIGPLLKVLEFDSAEERKQYVRERGWDSRTRSASSESGGRVAVQWYGERGIINAIVGHVQRHVDPVDALRAVLTAVQWADGGRPDWIPKIESATVLVEIGLADFGNPDVVIVVECERLTHCVFLEAKVVPYLVAMRPNKIGMQEPGFNSSINGQLALKYRFARALELAEPGDTRLTEPEAVLRAYAGQLNDGRLAPRSLAKPAIVQNILSRLGLLGLPETRCHYIALTWDTADRAFFRDPSIPAQDGLPCFLNDDGNDRYAMMAGRVGWLGYQLLEGCLQLQENHEYGAAVRTMVATSEPDRSAYADAQAVVEGRATPAAKDLAARLANLFVGFRVVEYSGSYSLKDGAQTIAKIVPRRDGVFVGVRGTVLPDAWASGTSETIAVQGVPFTGIVIPIDAADGEDLQFLLTGLEQRVGPA